MIFGEVKLHLNSGEIAINTNQFYAISTKIKLESNTLFAAILLQYLCRNAQVHISPTEILRYDYCEITAF